MSLKKLGAAMLAVLALSAVVASSASAKVETVPAQWYTGTTAAGVTTLPVGTSQPVTATVGNHLEIGTKGRLKGTIGEKAIEITSTGIECVECKIENKAAVTTGKPNVVAYGTGKIRFTGVSVDSPKSCKVTSEEKDKSGNPIEGQILTKSLVIHGDFMDNEVPTNQHAFIQFLPAEAKTIFAQFTLEGGECEAISGPYNVTGSVFGESKLNTGEAAASQELLFSPAIQKTAGAELKLGGNLAEFTGTGIFTTGSPKVGEGKKFFAIK
jgi:hypothetical protein